jgi:PAS domain S-box-containing protein
MGARANQGVVMEESKDRFELYQLLVNNSLGLMCIHDLGGVLLSVNPAVPESLGYPAGFGPGQNLRHFLVPEVRHLFDDYLRRIRRNRMDSGLLRLLAKDGTERIWMYRNILYEREGAPSWVLGHALDITERIRVERALKEAQAALRKMNDELASRVNERTAELKQTNERLVAEIEQRKQMEEELLRTRKLESLGVLAGGIAHDFNNFLTVVQGNIELARMQLDPDAPVQEVLEDIANASQRTAFLASQLLTFAKGGAPVRRVVSVAKLIQNAVNLARVGASSTITVEIPENLWAAEVDAEQVSQVLYNVLLNAKQAMPDHGIVEVRAENVGLAGSPGAGAFVRVSVRDYGCGIPTDALPRIFDPYFTTKPSGRGLGLATAYAIVSRHGGHISVESMVGVGTTFNIDLPASEMAPSLHEPIYAAPNYVSAQVLVMDDEEALRRLLERLLTLKGYTVRCAKDGAEAIELYEAAKLAGHPFDVALLDLTISGGMGGIETAARLRERDPSARLIVSSGYSDAPVMADFRSYGFDGMLPKPWKPEQVDEVLRMVLANRPDQQKR